MIKLTNGDMIDFRSAEILMDDDLREELHRTCISNEIELSNQRFYDLYCAAHYIKYHEEFEVN